MKKQFFRLFKIVAAVISVFFLSVTCQFEEELPDYLKKPLPQFQQVTFEAVSGEEPSTKTVLNGDGSLSWLPNDEINIFCGQDIYGRFISDNTEVAATTTFTGHFNTEVPATSTPDYWAVYPYMSTNTCDGNSVTLSVPTIQISKPGSFAAGIFPSVARSNSTRLAFYNVCGSIKFTVSRGDIDMITLASNGKEPLAGKVKVSFGSDGKPIAEALEGQNEVTVRPSNGSCFEPGEYYYLTVLPVTMSSGFTMTFHAVSGEEGTIETTNRVTIKRSASSKRERLDTLVSNWHPSEQGQDFSETGVYLGILAFNQELYTCPVGLLTASSLSTFKSYIDRLEMKNGTILYYAADNALYNMQQGQYPKNLTSASLISFTDGLDQGSLMLNSDYDTEDRYLSAVSSRIYNANISGIPLSSYSIGIRGSDVQNVDKFRNNLVCLASSESNAYEITDMSELNTRFENILKSVVTIEYRNCHDISLIIPGIPDGTRIRLTFGSSTASSDCYIEGTFNAFTKTLSDVVYYGLNSKSGSTVSGIDNGFFVSFCFKKVEKEDGETLSDDYVYLWQSVSGGTDWRRNVEFDFIYDIDASANVYRKSAIVYLILDCSSSLGNQFSNMKTSAKDFIQKLYEASYVETRAKSVKIAPSGSVLKIGEAIQFNAAVYPITALDRSVTWRSENPEIASVDDNGVVTGISTGETWIHAKSNDGGYDACKIIFVKDSQPVQESASFRKSGLYIGALQFNKYLYRLPICRLVDENVEDICSFFIDELHYCKGSLLNAAVDQAISNIQAPSYPEDLSKVVLVTFTDGFDQGSSMKQPEYSNNDYLSVIKQRIADTRVGSIPLTAYSVGVNAKQSSDRVNLEKLASSENNVYYDTKSFLNDLTDIANIVSIENNYDYICNLTVSIPGVGNGTKVRFTFDNVSNPSQSNLFIEGTFNLNNRSLTNVVYNGFSSSSGSTINGVVNGIFVTFAFNSLQKTDNTELSTQYMKEWTLDSSQSSWQINSEFNNSNDAHVDVTQTIRRESAVVYLVLDDSYSANSSGSGSDAAVNFIRMLQQQSKDPFSVSSIELNPTSLYLSKGETRQLVAKITPDNATDRSLVWTSSNESVATVDDNGIVSAISIGRTTITAKACDGSGITSSCTVTVASVMLDKTAFVIHNGGWESLTATVLSETGDNPRIDWKSSNGDVAVVYGGSVQGLRRGYATITAYLRDWENVSCSCEVEVQQYVTSITMEPTSLILKEGTTASLSVSVSPEDANNTLLKWTSSDESVATVDDDGRVTTKRGGPVTITAKACDGSGKSASCNIFVNSIPDVIDMGLSVKWASINLGAYNDKWSDYSMYGKFYAWGETTPNSFFDWSTYKWPRDSLKYGDDGKTVLDLEDDAAHANLGDNWRMPTVAEWQELIDNCIWEWTILENGVKGMKVTSNNGNSIFLPAAGYIYCGSRYSGNYSGDYWTSSLSVNHENDFAAEMTFGPYSQQAPRIYDWSGRQIGRSIRPVYVE